MFAFCELSAHFSVLRFALSSGTGVGRFESFFFCRCRVVDWEGKENEWPILSKRLLRGPEAVTIFVAVAVAATW